MKLKIVFHVTSTNIPYALSAYMKGVHYICYYPIMLVLHSLSDSEDKVWEEKKGTEENKTSVKFQQGQYNYTGYHLK